MVHFSFYFNKMSTQLSNQAAVMDSALKQANRWRLNASGIESDLKLLTRGTDHHDHIEMAGRSVNAIVQWRVNEDGHISLKRWVRWPMVREVADDTHAAFGHTFLSVDDVLPVFDGKPWTMPQAHRFWIDGCFGWEESADGWEVRRQLFPSLGLPALLERWEIRNVGTSPREVRIPSLVSDLPQDRALFKWMAQVVRVEWIGAGRRVLAPGETMNAGIVFSCREENAPACHPDIEAEWAARQSYCDSLAQKLVLTTPDPVINRLFAFSKLHAAENVLATRGGMMHAPGGFARFLAALWCNDQNEYASPFFPFLGDAAANESAINAYRWFARYQNDSFDPLPSSIVAEGRSVWTGLRDRGDAAMSAQGAARWALSTGDAVQAREIWPFICWCLAYCSRLKNEKGVIVSDSDELEGRFSSGRTNLATSCLTYDALISSALLGRALGESASTVAAYEKDAEDLRIAIERCFGAIIEGKRTYRYHEGLDRLRAWICLPLTVGIYDRAEGTVAALFSKNLWTDDGLLTEAGSTVYWDRSTLYALRGVFQSGYADEGYNRLRTFSANRLLGDHVPYAIEAFPEQNQSHLSAESALYCRIITDGICGIRPTGFAEFNCTPRLPAAWETLSLRNIHAFAHCWDLHCRRINEFVEVIVTSSTGEEFYRGLKPVGETHVVCLNI